MKSINLLPYDKPKDLPWGKRYEEAYEEFSTERPPNDNINTDLPYFLVKVPTLINQQNLEEIPFEPHPKNFQVDPLTNLTIYSIL